MQTKPSKSLKKKICISLDPEVVDGVEELAAKNHRTMSAYINLLLIKHISAKKGKSVTP